MAEKIVLSIFLLLFRPAVSQVDNSFYKEIPHYKSGEIISYYSTIKKYENMFKLDTIENGFDSLQIRVWYHYPKFRTPKNVFILKKQNNTWTTMLYSLDKDSLIIINPKSNLNMVIHSILKNKIMTLPNMDDIKGLEDGYVDGESYTIEISDKNHYRLYHYHVPEVFEVKFKDVKRLVNILKIIKAEFNIPLAHFD